MEYRRRLGGPLPVATGVMSERSGVIIRIMTDNGMIGYGEAAPLPGFSPETLDETVDIIRSVSSTAYGMVVPESPGGIGETVRQVIPVGYPAAVFGLETALGDLAAQESGKPLSSWLRPNPSAAVAVNYLTTGDGRDWKRVKADVEQGGYRTVKIKVGGRPDDDIVLIRRVADLLGGDVAIRLDANRRWTYETAVRVLNGLPENRIEYVEEPLTIPSPAEYARLKNETGVRIALDETLAEIDDIDALLSAGIADAVIIKPTILGGIARAVHLAETARKYGCNVVVTSAFESEVGLIALVHLAAAVCPEVACGLDTISIFDPSPSSHQFSVRNGAIAVPNKSGLGLDADIWRTK